MGPETIEAVITAIQGQVVQTVEQLVPVGQAVTAGLGVLAILMLGLSLMNGSLFLPQIVSTTGAIAATYWVLDQWGTIISGTLAAARQAIGLLIPGYSGPSALFDLGVDIASRVIMEDTASSWLDPVGAIGAAAATAIVPVLIIVGFFLTGLLAVLAEFQLLIGSAVAPLILPALAFGITAPMGWGPVRFVVSAAVRVVVMGVVGSVMNGAISTAIAMPGQDQVLPNETVWVLVGLSLLSALIGLCCNNLAHDLVGGGAGSIGMSSVQRTGGLIAGGANAVAAAGSAGVGAAGAGAAVARGAANMAGGATRAAQSASAGVFR